MTAPTMPEALGAWLLAGHAFDAVPLTEDVRWERGEDRMRQMYRSAPQIASVSALWAQDLYDTWVEFYEDTLGAGALSFYARVKSQTGDALVWWLAQIVAPPLESTQNRGAGGLNRYRVSMQLLLLEGPFASVPTGAFLLLQSGGYLLLQGGGRIILRG